MFWADKGNIFRSLKTSLHESLFLTPIIILIALFCNLNTHLAQKNQSMWQYRMKKAKCISFYYIKYSTYKRY